MISFTNFLLVTHNAKLSYKFSKNNVIIYLLDQALKEINKASRQDKIRIKLKEKAIIRDAVDVIPEKALNLAINNPGTSINIAFTPKSNENTKSLKNEIYSYFKEPKNTCIKRKLGITTVVFRNRDQIIVRIKYKKKYLETN